MKRVLLVVSVLLLLAAPTWAQAPPNRSAEVQQLVAGKYAGILNGNEDVRREVLRGICTDLNLLDAGRWGLLIKNDQNGRVPSDILVWRPTRQHFDVLTDFTAAWQDDGPIPEAWGWLECAPSTLPPPVVTPPPVVIVVPPPVTPPPVTVPLDLSTVLAKLDALEIQLKAHDENPSWLASVFGNRYVQLGLAAVGTWYTTQHLQGTPAPAVTTP